MKTIIALILTGIGIFPLAAQESRSVKLRAICFQHVDDLKNLYAISGGENPDAVEFPLYTTAISDEVDATVTNGKLTFATPDANATGPLPYKIIAQVKAAPSSYQLAIFFPGLTGGEPYRCMIIDDSPKAFPMGSTMAVNLSNVPIRLSIGEHIKSFAPGKTGIIPMAKKTNDRGQVSVIVSIADKASESGWRAVNQTRWFTGTDKRDLAIGFIHPKTGQPTVACYGDSPSWAAP